MGAWGQGYKYRRRNPILFAPKKREERKMGLLAGSCIGHATINTRRQLFLLPPAMRSQFNPSISIKPSQSHLQLQLSTNQNSTVVSALGGGIRDGETERSSPIEVKEEIQRCYQLVHRLGRGALYLGSSRVNPAHPHYLLALELSREACLSFPYPFTFLPAFVHFY